MAAAVRVHRVSKQFRRGEIHDSLRDLIGAQMRRLFRRQAASKGKLTFWALRDVSFEAAPGEALGIIGPNGAGKSTALRLLAGILRSDGGQIEVNGRLAALIEVSAGMHGDLTGRENIYLNAAIMGMSRREIRAKIDEIIAFSGLEKFIDTPVKRFSTGMQARLGFSTAAHVAPDVLLVDEVLSVGDAAFRHRCEERMTDLVRGGTALVFVTHNLEQMRKVCHRAIVLDRGERTYAGSPAGAVEHYLKATVNTVGAVGYADQPHDECQAARIRELRYLDESGLPVRAANPRKPLSVEIDVCLREPVDCLAVTVNLRRMGGELFISFGSQSDGAVYQAEAGDHRVSVRLEALPVSSGTYFTQVRLWDADRCRLLAETPYRHPLQCDDEGGTTGMLALPHHWSTLEACTPAPSGESLITC